MLKNIKYLQDSHLFNVFQALLVTFLWSTSWVLIKIGIEDISPIVFASLRYTLACFVLLPFLLFSNSSKQNLKSIEKKDWINLFWLGVVFYFLTQGLQFVALKYIPAVNASLFLNLSSLVTAFLGIYFLNEILKTVQWLGVVIFLAGILTFFLPVSFSRGELIGYAAITTQVFTNSAASILGRKINSTKRINPLVVTVVSMGIGSVLLLVTGLAAEGIPVLNLKSWAIITWLAIVNTAFAFTLWNNSLRKLSAVESSIINNTMLIQIAILAFFFLGETKTIKEIIGLIIAVAGVFLVNYKYNAHRRKV